MRLTESFYRHTLQPAWLEVERTEKKTGNYCPWLRINIVIMDLSFSVPFCYSFRFFTRSKRCDTKFKALCNVGGMVEAGRMRGEFSKEVKGTGNPGHPTSWIQKRVTDFSYLRSQRYKVMWTTRFIAYCPLMGSSGAWFRFCWLQQSRLRFVNNLVWSHHIC